MDRIFKIGDKIRLKNRQLANSKAIYPEYGHIRYADMILVVAFDVEQTFPLYLHVKPDEIELVSE